MKLRGNLPRDNQAFAVVLAFSCAVAGPFACAAGDERPGADEDGGVLDAGVLPEAAPPDASDSEDARGDAIAQSQCSAGGFCYYPLPVQKPLVGISASGVDDVWAIADGAIVRWDGTAWREVHRPPLSAMPDSPAAIWVTKVDDVWALSGETLVRYSAKDGGTPTFRSFAADFVASSDALSLWAAPATAPSSPMLWIASGGDAVVRLREADQGAAEPIEIETMTPQADPQVADVYTWTHVVGFGPDDVYVGGAMCPEGFRCAPPRNDADPIGAIAHYDGTSWTITLRDRPMLAMSATHTPAAPRRLWLLEGVDPGSFGGSPWDASFELVPLGDDGSLGAALVTQPLVVSPWGAGCTKLSVATASANEAWFSDGCLVQRWNGSAFETMPTSIQNVARGRVNAIWAANPEDGWIVGESSPRGPGFPLHTGFAGQRKSQWANDGGQP